MSVAVMVWLPAVLSVALNVPVPLDSVLRSGSDTVPGFKLPDRKRVEDEAPGRRPHLFKVVNVMTRDVLAEGVHHRITAGFKADDVNVTQSLAHKPKGRSPPASRLTEIVQPHAP